MRIAALTVVLCLLVSPAAYAGEQVKIELEISRFLNGLWEALMTIPTIIDKAVDSDSATAVDSANGPIEPPEGEAGPMIIVNG